MLIADRPDFQLDLTVAPVPGSNLLSVDLQQRWPKAQHPHWRRICQLNLTREEAARFSAALLPDG